MPTRPTSPIPLTLLAAAALSALSGPARRAEARDIPPSPEVAQPKALAEQVAERYGLAAWGEVVELRYTFNVARGGELKASRQWIWRPKDGQVTYKGPGEGGEVVEKTWAAFHPGEAEDARQLDHAFINDQYWLIFPFHLVWDEGTRLEELGHQATPFGGGEGERLAISYMGGQGYTPGDRYDLWVGGEGLVTHWAYTPAGATEPKMFASWDETTPLGPLTLSLSHTNADRSFALWFSDVSVTTAAGTFKASAASPLTGAAAAPASP